MRRYDLVLGLILCILLWQWPELFGLGAIWCLFSNELSLTIIKDAAPVPWADRHGAWSQTKHGRSAIPVNDSGKAGFKGPTQQQQPSWRTEVRGIPRAIATYPRTD